MNELALRCREENIHTAIETCAYVPWKNFEKVLANIDLFMFDVKHTNPEKHKELCGRSNRLIFENLKRLSKVSGKEAIIRVPLIPGMNDSAENLQNIARLAASLDGNIRRIELLPYHRFGEKKYERLGREYALNGVSVPSEERMQEFKHLMEGFGIDIKVGG